MPPEIPPETSSADPVPRQEILDPSDGRKGIVAISTKYSSGPLPTPEDFAAYGEVLENAPERILTMAEKSADARNEAQTSYAKSHVIRQHYIGIATLILPIVTLGIAGLLFWQENLVALFPLILGIGPRFLKAIKDLFKD